MSGIITEFIFQKCRILALGLAIRLQQVLLFVILKSTVPGLNQLQNLTHGEITVSGLRPEPYNCTLCTFIDSFHEVSLVAPLLLVGLVDTHCVDPD